MARPVARVGVLLLLLVVAPAYLWRLDRHPPSLYVDEVVFALQAQAIAETGHDLSGRRLPLYFQMRHIDEHSWFHPVIVYLTAALFAVGLPVTEFGVRLPSVVIAAANVILVYFVARRLLATRASAWLAAALLALTPAHVMHARMAMDFLYPVPFMLAWLLALLGYLRTGRVWQLAAATSALGVGVYSYIAAVMLMPLYLGLTLMVLWWTGRREWPPYLAACAGFVWPLGVLAAWLPLHPEVIAHTVARYGVGGGELSRPGWDDITGRLSLYWSYFDPAYLFVTGGLGHMFSTTRRVGALLLPMAVLIPGGLFAVATRGFLPADRLVVLGFFTAPLAACALPEPYALDRHLVLLPFAALLGAAGAERLLQARPPWRGVAIASLCLLPLHFAFFQYDYWVDYPARAAYRYQGNRRAALDELIARADAHPRATLYLNEGRVPYVRAHWEFALRKHGREELLSRTRFYGKAAEPPPPADGLVITTADDVAGRDARWTEVIAFPEPGNPPVLALLERREPVRR